MVTMKGNSGIYEGPSVSEMANEPNIEVNTIFYELDSGKWYYYKTDETWAEIPNTGGGGGGGFVPTEEQLAAMNSGINSEGVAQIGTNTNNISSEQAKTVGMSEGGSNYITVGGRRVYVDSNPPTGARTDDLWIGG